MQNYEQIGDIDHYSLHNSYLLFQLLRYSFLYLKVLVKPELSMHGPIWDFKIFQLFLNLQWKIPLQDCI